MKWAISLLGLTLTSTLVVTQPMMNDVQAQSNQTILSESIVTPTFTNVSVHDPSVIKVDDYYYVFGSHLGVAKTKDFMNWELVNSGVKDDNPIIPNIYTELKEVFDWAQSDTLWAADVIELNGKYYMYYNACQGSQPLSAMGIAVSDHIEGPYEDQGIFLTSGKGTAPDGTPYHSSIHPNAVDPDVFYDKDGKLWMVYGSYSGGIFILEMDETTGLPKEGQTENNGYGKRLFGGSHLRIEGAYMQYSPETDYYYLFVSYGGLAAGDGYNLRVSRSKTPNGDFEDISGNLMKDLKARPGVAFDDESMIPYGNKIMGDFKFSNLNRSSNFVDYGYVSSGHNSTYYDETTGQYFNIFHTRFPNRGEDHEVRVHQMFMNQDGWLVVAPHRYANEQLTKVDASSIVGGYHYINHGKGVTDSFFDSVYIELKEDGQVTGTVEGSWKLVDDYYAEITIKEDRKENIYRGVFIEQWDSTQSKYVMAFTAISDEGVTIWGSSLGNIVDEELVQTVLEQLSISRTGRVYEDLELVTTGAQNTNISWASSNESIIEINGTVHRPKKDTNVTLTATVTKGGVSLSKSFPVTVKAQAEKLSDGLVAYYPFSDSYQSQIGKGQTIVVGSSISSIGGCITFNEGVNGQAAYFDGQSGLVLPSNLLAQAETYTISLWLKPEQLTIHTPSLFIAADEDNWSSLAPQAWDNHLMLWSKSLTSLGERWYDGATNYTMPTDSWTHVAYSYNKGTISVYVNGVERFTGVNFPDLFASGQVKMALGVNSFGDNPYKGGIDEIRIYEKALTLKEISILANEAQVDLKKGLVAQYNFDQTLEDLTGTFAAATLTGNRLTLPSSDEVVFSEGVSESALVFDGSHGIKLPNSLITSNSYSVSLWLKPEFVGNYTPVFFGAMQSSSWISLLPYSFSDNKLMLWSGEAWYDGVTTQTLSNDQWSNVTFTYDKGEINVYIDGELCFSGINFPDIFNGEGAEFGLGVNYWDAPYQGLIDELRIYNTVLTPQQIKTIANIVLERPVNPEIPKQPNYEIPAGLEEILNVEFISPLEGDGTKEKPLVLDVDKAVTITQLQLLFKGLEGYNVEVKKLTHSVETYLVTLRRGEEVIYLSFNISSENKEVILYMDELSNVEQDLEDSDQDSGGNEQKPENNGQNSENNVQNPEDDDQSTGNGERKPETGEQSSDNTEKDGNNINPNPSDKPDTGVRSFMPLLGAFTMIGAGLYMSIQLKKCSK